MKCTNCNREFYNNAKFCPWCGTPATGHIDKSPDQDRGDSLLFMKNRTIPEYSPVPLEEEKKVTSVQKTVERETGMNRMKPGHIEKSAGSRYDDSLPKRVTTPGNREIKKSAFNEYKGIIITLISVVVIAVTFLILYFCTDLFGGEEVYACTICNTELQTNEKFCEQCAEDYKCENCDTIDENVKEGYCKDCRDEHICEKCGDYSETLRKGYCQSCVIDFTCDECGEISDFITKGYCKDCVKDYTCKECQIVDSSVENGYCEICIEQFTCKACGDFSEKLKEGYCKDCVADYTCESCDKITDSIDGGYCAECAEKYICRICSKFNKKLTDGFCNFCRKDYKCDECGKIDSSVSDGKCSDCKTVPVSKKTKCYYCADAIYTDSSYKDSAGHYYCDDCDSGFYCATCKAPTSGSNKKYCSSHEGIVLQ